MPVDTDGLPHQPGYPDYAERRAWSHAREELPEPTITHAPAVDLRRRSSVPCGHQQRSCLSWYSRTTLDPYADATDDAQDEAPLRP